MISSYRQTTVKIRNRSGFNAAGESSYSTAVSLLGRVEEGDKRTTDKEGREVNSTFRVYLAADTTIGDAAEVSIDGGTTYYPIIAYRQYRQLNGRVGYVKVSL